MIYKKELYRPYKTLSLHLLFIFGMSLRPFAQTSALTIDSADLPVVWLRADKGAVSPNLWSDYTGSQHDATSIYGQSPLRNALFNYNPAFSFDGVNHYMKVGYSVEGLPEITIMAVYQTYDTTEVGVWGAENALSRNILMTTRRVAGPDSALDAIGQNENLAVLSTVLQSWTGSQDTSRTAYLSLGSAGKLTSYKPFKGVLAELLVFNKRLDVLTKLQYETYLAIKYGIPIADGNYISTAQQVLWPADENKQYQYHIAGLGKDNSLALDQKQSKSSLDSLLTISIGQRAGTNAGNTAPTNNGDFFIWGDNNAAMSTSANGDGTLDILNRKWLMKATGNTVTNAKTSIYLDLKRVPSYPKGYWLVIDRTGQSNFSTDGLSYILPDSISADSMVVYNNVNWDTDRSGKDLFSFAKAKDLLVVMNLLDSPTCQSPLAGRTNVQAVGGKAPYQYELTSTAAVTVRQGNFPDRSNSLELGGLPLGNYSFRLRDADGHEVIRQFGFRVPDTLAIDLGPDRQLTPGDEILLDATAKIDPSVRVSYNWYGDNGFRSSVGRISVKEPGRYRVEATNAQGCVFSDEVLINAAGKQLFEVYPTISKDGNFNVGVSLPRQGDATVSVYDMKGNKYSEMHGGGNISYKFSGHISTSGMYMVVLKTDNGTESKKIIVL